MNDKYFEETIGQIYDLVENAKTGSFNKDKITLDKNQILNLLDELSERLPGELKQARVMLESNAELVTAAKRKAEQILKDAAEKARKMVSEQEIYQEAKARANEMVRSAQLKAAEVNKAAIEFMDDSLKATEEAIAQALSDVRNTRGQFRAIKGGSGNKASSAIIEDI